MRVGLGGISGTNILSIGLGVSVGGGGGVQPQPFVGAYDDIPDIAALYAMRRALSDYTDALIRVRRDSDNEEQDIGYTSAGDLDTAALASWLGEANGYITTWYDQSGNANHATQTTAAAQPLYVASGQNSRPVVRGDGVSSRMTHTFAAGANEKSLLVLASVASQTGYRGIYGTDDSTPSLGLVMLSRFQEGDNWGTYDGTDRPANSNIQAAGWQVLEMIEQSDGSGSFFRNGSADGSFAATRSQNVGGHLFGSSGGNQLVRGDIAEIVVASVAWSTAQRQAAEAAANSYWSVY